MGGSEAGSETPTVEHIVTELHALLANLQAPPPYVLVGHSWGGPIVHTFAARRGSRCSDGSPARRRKVETRSLTFTN